MQDHGAGRAAGVDFESAALLSGARFSVMRGLLARCTGHLAAFMLTYTQEHGYTECYVPHIVNAQTLRGTTASCPKFEADLFAAKRRPRW